MVMFEVLNRERMKEVSGLLQLVGVLLGFGVMLIIEIFGNKIQMFASVVSSFTIVGPHHEHGHEHEHEGESFHQVRGWTV